MIVGIGVELVDVVRFGAAAERLGPAFRERLFTAGERAHGRGARGLESLAARFAAKLAARRALGRPTCRWHDVEVVRERGRAPTLTFRGAAAEAARALGVSHVNLSLTHDRLWSVGQVVLEGSRDAGGAGR